MEKTIIRKSVKKDGGGTTETTTELRIEIQAGIDLPRIARLAAARFREANVLEVASSMTLATLLSIVPLLAVALAMFSVIPAFEPYRHSLEAFLAGIIPGEYSIQIFYYLQSFSQHAKGLSAFGFAGLALSAYFLIDKLFFTIGRIFHARRRRSLPQNAILYWAILTLGPMAVVASLSATACLARLALAGLSSTAAAWGLNALTLLLQGVFYAALYALVPNCCVNWRHALAAGLLTATAGLLLKWGFSIYISTGTLASLYGAFAALPVFVLWIYASWILVFGGAVIAATLPMMKTGRFADSYKPGNDFATAVALLDVLLQEKRALRPVVSIKRLCEQTDSWPELAESALGRLAQIGYVSEVRSSGRRSAWVLIADPAAATLKPVFEAFVLDPSIKLLGKKSAARHPWSGLLLQSQALGLPLEAVLRGPGAG